MLPRIGHDTRSRNPFQNLAIADFVFCNAEVRFRERLETDRISLWPTANAPDNGMRIWFAYFTVNAKLVA